MSVLGWGGAGGGYFDPAEEPWPDDLEPLGQGPPIRRDEVEVWCDRCGRPRRESAVCVACGDET